MPRILEFPDDDELHHSDGFIISGKTGNVATALLVAPPRRQHEDQQMIVLRGSKFGPLKIEHSRHAERILKRLSTDGMVKQTEDGSYVFTNHVLFPNPSRAAKLLL